MSGLFGGGPSTPEIKPPAPMPDSESPAILEAGRRRRGEMTRIGGRASTILSDARGDTGDYSRRTVG